MLKITTQISADTTTLQLEGKLRSPWIEVLDRYWRKVPAAQRKMTLVDLTEVIFIGHEGKALLTRMWQQGATFRAAGCLNTSILDEITHVERADSLSRKTRK